MIESHLCEADLKELQVKIVALQQDLMMAQNEKKKLEIETNSLIDKHKIELRVSQMAIQPLNSDRCYYLEMSIRDLECRWA